MTNSDAIRADERRRWASTAPAWRHWAAPLAAMAERFNQPLVEAAVPPPSPAGIRDGGMRVLDLASGAGEPALSLARRLGRDGGLVVATDLVPAMLAGLRERTAEDETAAGAARIAPAAADMESLPFAPASFDAVTCRFGLMFCPSPEQALAEARRVLRPGGRAVFMVWGPAEENTTNAVLAASVEAVAGPAPPGERSLFRLAADGALAGCFAAAGGYRDAVEQTVRFAPRIPLDPATPGDPPFWQATLDMAFGHRLADFEAAALGELHRSIRDAFARRIGEDGRVALDVHLRIGIGTA
jgi:SAM-dependent methyltransferase